MFIIVTIGIMLFLSMTMTMAMVMVAIATIRGAAQIPGLLLPQWNGPLRHIISRPSSS